MAHLSQKFDQKYGRYFAYFIFTLSFFRLFFAIDFFDEAYYLALPHAFTMGTQPFVDEIFPQQFSALLMAPMLSIYKFFSPEYSGLFLFSRICFYLLCLITSLIGFKTFKKHLSCTNALLVAAVFTAYHPFNLPTLSYNTLSYLFFSMGLLLSFNNRPLSLGFSGLTFTLAAFCYPYIALPVGLHFLFPLLKSRKEFLTRILRADFLVALFLSVVLGAFLFSIGIENILGTVRLVRQWGVWTSGLQKVGLIFTSLPKETFFAWFISLLGFIYFLREHQWKWNQKLFETYGIYSSVLFLISSVIFWGDASLSFFSKMGCIQIVSGALLFGAARKCPDPLTFKGRYLWLFGSIAGLTTAYSSANGIINSGMGFALATIGLFLMIHSAVGVSDKVWIGKSRWFARTPLLSLILILTALVYSQVRYSYRDEQPIYKLRTLITSGPYRGLFTSLDKKNFIEKIQSEVTANSTDAKTILFFDEFPVGYLLAPSIKPFTQAIWIFQLGHWTIPRQVYVDYYSKKDKTPDLIFDFKEIYENSQNTFQMNRENDPLRIFFESKNYQLISENDFVRVLLLQ